MNAEKEANTGRCIIRGKSLETTAPHNHPAQDVSAVKLLKAKTEMKRQAEETPDELRNVFWDVSTCHVSQDKFNSSKGQHCLRL